MPQVTAKENKCLLTCYIRIFSLEWFKNFCILIILVSLNAVQNNKSINIIDIIRI